MRSEGYGSCRVCLSFSHSFILSVMRELTSPVIDHVKNKLTYPAVDGGQKICGIFSEIASLQSWSVFLFVRYG